MLNKGVRCTYYQAARGVFLRCYVMMLHEWNHEISLFMFCVRRDVSQAFSFSEISQFCSTPNDMYVSIALSVVDLSRDSGSLTLV